MNRSWLFVPADSDRKLVKARDADADALIVDLEDSVAASRRPAARRQARDFLTESADDKELWLRINPLDGDDAIEDLRAVMAASPAGIVLPKPADDGDIARLGELLDALEVEHGLPAGRTRILPLVTERPGALFNLQRMAAGSTRLAALSWGAEDLSAALGAAATRDAEGRWLPVYQLARSLCLLAAASAELPAIDTVYTDYRDAQGLGACAAAARRDGFAGMLAIHPAQVGIINAAFTPTDDELARARRIVALFAENPDAGTLGMDGEMLDRPHLILARRILAMAGEEDRGGGAG